MQLNKYETVIVIRTDITEDSIDTFHLKVFETLKALGGQEIKFEVWGKRKLAYEIKKNMKGIYIYYLFAAPTAAIDKLERSLRLNELVLRFLTVALEADINTDNYDFVTDIGVTPKPSIEEDDEEEGEEGEGEEKGDEKGDEKGEDSAPAPAVDEAAPTSDEDGEDEAEEGASDEAKPAADDDSDTESEG
jgi:small subunit ribosomal protein S6